MAKLTTAEMNKVAREYIIAAGLTVVGQSCKKAVASKTACFSIRAGKIRIERHVAIIGVAGQELVVDTCRKVQANILLGLCPSKDHGDNYTGLTDAQKKQIDDGIFGFAYDEFTV